MAKPPVTMGPPPAWGEKAKELRARKISIRRIAELCNATINQVRYFFAYKRDLPPGHRFPAAPAEAKEPTVATTTAPPPPKRRVVYELTREQLEVARSPYVAPSPRLIREWQSQLPECEKAVILRYNPHWRDRLPTTTTQPQRGKQQ